MSLQVRSARNELDRVNQEANNNRSRVSALERENADLKRQSVVTYRGQQKRVGDAVSETVKKVTDRLKIASSRNVAAMPAEAIPYFGIAVIVGATAWELKDACELMKDMRELEAAFNPSNPISEDAVCGMTPPTRDEIWTAIRDSPGDVWAKAKSEFPELRWPEIELPEWASATLPEWPSVTMPEWPSVAMPEWPEIELPDIESRVGAGWKWLNCSTLGGADCGD